MAKIEMTLEGLSITFGDRVRIRQDADTDAVGMSGEVGEVRGVTTPSVTGVAVVGRLDDDCAFDVYVERLNRGAWFSPSLLSSTMLQARQSLWTGSPRCGLEPNPVIGPSHRDG